MALCAAGADTTPNWYSKGCVDFGEANSYQNVASMSWLFLAMTIFLNVPREAQTEIDRIVETGRLPEVQDRSPYLDAALKEVLHWAAISNLFSGPRFNRI